MRRCHACAAKDTASEHYTAQARQSGAHVDTAGLKPVAIPIVEQAE